MVLNVYLYLIYMSFPVFFYIEFLLKQKLSDNYEKSEGKV